MSAEEIRRRGWRQGSVAEDALRDELLACGNLLDATSSDLLILITHDCTIVSGDFEEEPTAEFLLARAIPESESDGNYAGGKSPRRLQFDAAGSLFEIRARERVVVERAMLARFSPDPDRRLSDERVRLFAHWMAKRYLRAALPDAFNQRTASARARVRRKLKTDGHLVSGIHVTLDRAEELPDGEPYVLAVYVVARTDDAEAESERLGKLTKQIDQALASCDGIKVAECELRAERDFTLEDLNQTIEWDVWDDLSFRETS